MGPVNLSFAGSGFLGIYHLGVAKALVNHGNKFLLNVQNFTGASAGILVAAILSLKGPDMVAIQKYTEFTLDLGTTTNKKAFGVLTPRYSLLKSLEKFLCEMCPENSYLIASGRLHVSLTKHRTRKNVTVSEFRSDEHMIQCLLASAYIPFITGTHVFEIDGQKYVDGGFSDNLPSLKVGRTITVSPFCGKENICPVDSHCKGPYTFMGNMSVQLSTQNGTRGIHALFPPNRHGLIAYHDRGYLDAVRFLKREGIYQKKSSSTLTSHTAELSNK